MQKPPMGKQEPHRIQFNFWAMQELERWAQIFAVSRGWGSTGVAEIKGET